MTLGIKKLSLSLETLRDVTGGGWGSGDSKSGWNRDSDFQCGMASKAPFIECPGPTQPPIPTYNADCGYNTNIKKHTCDGCSY